MWNCALLVLYTLSTLVKCSDEVWRLVNITQGPVRGRMDPDGGLYSFYNIPYATAPTGPNRFKAPLPPPTWLSTFDAVDKGIVCIQPSVAAVTMQEDCLVVNVFIPDTQDTNIPVIISIHGGAYQYGYGLGEQFKDLVRTKKVIAVSFNYRLGVHGFLCLGSEGAPGNAGLKDQLAALRWVNKNIASFGGNPEDVTLVGCSAGSVSIDILTLSSVTTGLFKKAIMESGVNTGIGSLQTDPIENARKYAKLLNFDDVNDLDKLEEFYKTATFQQLISHAEATDDIKAGNLFNPCLERDIGQERIIKNEPMNFIKQGNYTKIPLLYGFTDMDGGLRLPNFETFKARMNEKFSDFLPPELYFESENVKEDVAQKVKKFYFGEGPVSNDSIVSYLHYFTDTAFALPMLRSLTSRVEALGDTIYLFEYSYVDEDTPTFPHTAVRGADHCSQLYAVMDEDVTDRTEEYKRMKEIMRDYWFNFISTSSPLGNDSVLSTWPPANARRSPHMSLGSVIELKEVILEDRAALWDSIYEKHYRGPLLYFEDETDGAVSLMISNFVFFVVLVLFYLNL